MKKLFLFLIRARACSLFVLSICLSTFIGTYSSIQAQLVDNDLSYASIKYENAKYLYDKGLFHLTDFTISKLIENYKDNASGDRLYLLRADLDLANQNYILADKKLSEFIQERSNSPFVAAVYMKRAIMSFNSNKFEKAELLFNNTFLAAEADFKERKDTNYSSLAHQALYWKGISQTIQGKTLEALQTFKSCNEKYPQGEFADDAMYNSAQLTESQRKYEDAIDLYKKMRIYYPKSNLFTAALVRQSNNELILRQSENALINLEKVENILNSIRDKDSIGLTFQPQNFEQNSRENLLYLRGEASNQAGNFDQALKYFTSFIETFSNSDLINHVKLATAWAYLNKKDYTNSLKYYQQVIDDEKFSDPNNKALAYLYRAIIFKKTGKVEQAQKEISQLTVQSGYPYLGLALLELGQIYYEAKDYQQARKTLERADREAIEPVLTTRILLLLGASYMELTNYEKAIATYFKAEQLAFNSSESFMPQKRFYLSEARLKQGIAYVQSQRSSQAIPKLSAYIADAGNDTRKDEALFWLAESYYRNDMLQNAIKTYQNVLTENPQTKRKEEVLYGLGWSFFRLKNFLKSSEVFNQLVKDFPKSKYAAEVLARQGDGYYLVKNYSAAIESYSKAAKIGPNTEEGKYSSYQMCHALFMSNQYEKAIGALLNYVQTYKKSELAPNALYLIGWIRFQQKRYNEAIDNYRYLIEAYPSSGLIANTHYSIADAYYNFEDYEKAMQEYKFVVENYPSNALAPEAMRGVQQCLELLDRGDEAIEIINKYTASNTDSPFYWKFVEEGAIFKFEKGKYSDAINEYEKIVANSPNESKTSESLYWIGRSYASLENSAEAEKAFVSIEKKYPNSYHAPLALLEYGLLSKKNNDVVKADSIFALLINRYPENVVSSQAAYERALMKFGLGDTASSVNLYYFVADTYPNSDYGADSRYKIANYLRMRGLNDSSRVQFAKLIEQTGSKEIAAEAQYRIGELWKKEKNNDEAIAAFEIVKDKYTGSEDWFSLSLLNLGEIYEEEETWDKARELYNILSELRPDDDFGKTAKRRLLRLPKKGK